ncbi:MAG: hypothetical protein Q8914_13255 [Bacteroidota bacterium]|nr:hypothetical protein [Bacteroidota bacterium]
MKHPRFFLKICAVTLTGALAYSCIDDAYDLSNLSKKFELFGNSLAFPVGYTTIHMDSVINGLNIDASTLSVEDGKYVFNYSGSMDMSGLTNAISDFKLATISPVTTPVNLFDASSHGGTYTMPAGFYEEYTGSTTINLPSFTTSLISVDSIALKNAIMQITLGSTGLGGTKLASSISITFTALDNNAEYIVNGVPKTTWTIHMGETCNVGINKLRLSGSSPSLGLSETVVMNVAGNGDVTATGKTKMNITMNVLDGMDFNTVYGKVSYSKTGTLDPISFTGLNEKLGNDDVLSFYNPSIQLMTEGNLGVPINFNLEMGTSNSKTGQSRSLSNADFTLHAAASPVSSVKDTFLIDKTYGTDQLFKINPDQINLGYHFQTLTNTSYDHFIAKDSRISMKYAMKIPLQFGGDLNIGMSKDSIDNPIDLSKLDNQDNLKVALTLNVENRIPLSLKLELTAYDENHNELFTAESGSIAAANPIDPVTGFATAAQHTSTEISLTSDQINKLKDTKTFKATFIITSNNLASFVTVQPSDYISFKIGAKTEGGVQIDLDKNSSN